MSRRRQKPRNEQAIQKTEPENACNKAATHRLRIYSDGVFDLFHYAHARVFKQIKERYPDAYLIVGVASDEDTIRYKGMPVLDSNERCESVRYCRYVDEVIKEAPWRITTEFLKKHEIEFVAHDDTPYPCDGIDDIYGPIKEAGMFLATQRTCGISTTDIITRVLRNSDVYFWRQMRKGVSRKELNLSAFSEGRMVLTRRIQAELEGLRRTTCTFGSLLMKGCILQVRSMFTNVVKSLRRC